MIKTLYSREVVEERIKALAAQIDQDYNGRPGVVLVGVLTGAYMFHAQLSSMITTPHEIDFVRTSSYVGVNSSGIVTIGETHTDLSGKNVILVEDIVDTGLSMTKLITNINEVATPTSMEVCTLLDKPAGRKHDLTAKYVGFELVGKPFVIGYGMDYNQKYRHLPFVGIFEG